MTVATWLKQAGRQLTAAGITSARLDSLVLLEYVSGRPRSYWLARPESQLPSALTKALASLLTQRATGQPIPQLTGRQEFYGLNFEITTDVLSPRPESEQIAELAIALAPHRGRLLDVGTGSGALAIAIATHRPDLEITASEVSSAALGVARRNAATHRVQINFIESDLLHQVRGKFHLIVTNLPYVAQPSSLTPGAKHEPMVALIGGGSDGLDLYRGFFQQLPRYLMPGAWVICESDPWQQPALNRIAQAVGLTLKQQDYFVSTFQPTEAIPAVLP